MENKKNNIKNGTESLYGDIEMNSDTTYIVKGHIQLFPMVGVDTLITNSTLSTFYTRLAIEELKFNNIIEIA